ncbi:MAG: hypothetical protein M0Z98_03920 [Actinomycetales bacterium]|nr:hypothetical protein [Actinomycetales bacterium]
MPESICDVDRLEPGVADDVAVEVQLARSPIAGRGNQIRDGTTDDEAVEAGRAAFDAAAHRAARFDDERVAIVRGAYEVLDRGEGDTRHGSAVRAVDRPGGIPSRTDERVAPGSAIEAHRDGQRRLEVERQAIVASRAGDDDLGDLARGTSLAADRDQAVGRDQKNRRVAG